MSAFRKKWLFIFAVLAGLPCFAQNVSAQELSAPVNLENRANSSKEIVVEATRLRGQLDVEEPPILVLNEEDIIALGTGSIADLITVLGPQTNSARGRGGGGFPLFLVNGLRVGSYRELRSYPPEAVATVEVLGEEVARRFGFSADRRVVNIVLKENFSSREIELELERPEKGGYWRNQQEFTLLTISDGARLNVNIEASDQSLLTEAERSINQTLGTVSDLPDDPNPASYRSLIGDTRDLEATINWAKAFFDSGSSLSSNITYNRFDGTSLAGLNGVLLTSPDGRSLYRTFGEDDPLEVRNFRDTFSASASFSRRIGEFQLTATSNLVFNASTTEIDQRVDVQGIVDLAANGSLELEERLPVQSSGAFDVSTAKTITATNKATVRGSPILLPAGELTTTLDLGINWERVKGRDTRTDVSTNLERRTLDVGFNLVVPLTSKREGVLPTLGTLSLNGGVGYTNLSDFSSLYDWTTGLSWQPFDGLNLQISYVWKEEAPNLSSLGDPIIITPNRPVFDFVTGSTVLTNLITGGNENLISETQSDWRMSANWQLPFWDGTRLTGEYIRNRSENVTSQFPSLSREIESAFPDRVLRNSDGVLLSLDRRPITFQNTSLDKLVFGLSSRGSWGRANSRTARRQTNSQDSNRSNSDGGARGIRGNPISSGFGRDGRGRYFASLNHSIELQNKLLVSSGLNPLDLLRGDAQGDFARPRHSTRLEAGFFRGGAGLRLSGSYLGKAKITGNGTESARDLFFADLATFDIRAFANLGTVFKSESEVLKGLTLSVLIDNVFDGRRVVLDGEGTVPIRYQASLLDPNGRYIGFDLRKVF